MLRFERIYDVVEEVEQYRAGGYHPVHLKDTFHQRYQVVGKWAYGQFSIVWLAKDTRLYSPTLLPYYTRDYQTDARLSRLQKYVTLKILKADASRESQELPILLHLSKANTNHPGRNSVLQLLDHFEHRGPNGLHLCLVFPVMLSDGNKMTIEEKPRHSNYVREISKQILQGLDFIHDQGLIHGDLHPANILFTVNSDSPEEMLIEPELAYVHWRPGVEVDNSAPRYLVTSQRPDGMLDNTAFSELTVRVGDLGGAIWNTQHDVDPVTPLVLQAPELLQPHSRHQKADIWAFGCLIFQLSTNEPLFPAESFGCTSDESREMLLSRMYTLFENGIQGFAMYLGERIPNNFGQDNSEKLVDFLWSALQEHAEDRKSTTDLLNHPFLVG
ncbi:hypothetical protein ABOM_000697 [Aspergillus bombycis]|uniref:non-specific serine/threonine protein kinase n=1 Tax=Aspergillus bombycis TaxID=109264 RepID=A0A1F8AHW7_9EURO|nr:hypothetical protein ABOM_000697 [Aspergillus bombycis]OGM50898.1 hypothetical protein ABOM_000697 [Aspergillus bombycis]